MPIMIDYLRLIRPLNLLLIVLVQCVIKFGLLEVLNVPTALNSIAFTLLVVATVAIAAAGYVINDIQDQEIDKINKPNKTIIGRKISEKSAFGLYIILTIIGVGAGFYVSNLVGYPGLASVFIIISALLYVYANQLKSALLVGNIIVSAIVAMSLLVFILFDIFPAINNSPTELQLAASSTILMYSGFAFYFNLLREIVKDIQDVDGDKNGGRNTLPIVLGRQRAVTISFVMGVIALIGILAFTYFRLYQFQKLAFYFVFLIGGPLLFYCIKAWDADSAREYQIMSITLKVVFLTGICSLLFFSETIPIT